MNSSIGEVEEDEDNAEDKKKMEIVQSNNTNDLKE